jgi:predicted Zn finger-like uncharacterized protein
VIITCPECDTKYRYDERRFDGESVKKVKCTSCGFMFEAANPVIEPVVSSEPADPEEKVSPAESPGGPPAGWNPAMAETDDPTPVPASVDQSSSVESDQDDPIPPLPRDPRYSLAVIAGGQAGSVFQIHKPRIQLGRGSAMDIQLRDSEVSRRHALIEIRDPDVTLTDLDTTNGTWFNGSKIKTATINHQDEFTLGSTTLMLIVTPVQDVH